MASKSSDSIEEARAAVFTAVEACDIVGARAALECLRHLEGDSPNPPGHAGSVGDDSVDALTGMAATAIHCSGSDATACVKRLADVQTKLASIDSQIRQAREQQKKALEEVNIDEVERLDHVATRLYKDRTPLEETLARLLNGLIGCVARVLIRSGPKLERLKKELNVKVSLKDFTAAKMIGTNIKAIQRCVEQVKPVAAALRRGIELTDATLSMLKMMVGVSASECRAVGLTPLQLKAAKFTLKELKAAKFTLAELKTAKYTFAEIKAAKFTFAELKAAKFTAAELKAAKFPIAECMILPGIFRSDLERAGFNVDAMKAHDKALYDEMYDSSRCRPTEVERLVKLGANGSGYKDGNGWTALITAAYLNNPKCVKLMLSTMSKDEAAVQDNDGDTALYYAAYEGHAKCVELLLQHMDRRGVMLKECKGKTAKEWAQKNGHAQCVALFTKHGY